jgi:hypothetical protein
LPLETNNDFESDKENCEKVKKVVEKRQVKKVVENRQFKKIVENRQVKKVVEKRQVKITDCFQTQNIEEKIYCKCPGGKTLAVKNTVS